MPEGLTRLTKPHKEVIRYLQLRGLEIAKEVDFPPFTVDIYLPKYHAAIEVDGPMHTPEKDGKRNSELLGIYYLPVVHIPTEQASKPEEWWTPVATWLNQIYPSVKHRKEYCENIGEGV